MNRRRCSSARLLDLLPLESRELLTTIIAIIDSGVDLNDASVVPYLDLTSAYDAYNKQTYTDVGAQAILDTSMTHGHGSVVAAMTVRGIEAAAATSDVVPDVKIMPIRDTSSGLVINPNAVIRGIHWAADHGASVINLSVNFTYNPTLYDPGDPLHGTTLVAAISYAESKGAVVVTGPGNQARNIELSPVFPPFADDALYSNTRPTPTNVLVAAAVDSSGSLSPISNWGPFHVDLGAYAGPEGATSYSSAYTAGVAGVVAELLPDGSAPSRVIDVLESTVRPTTQSVGAWSKTGGVLDPAAAVAKATQNDAPATPPGYILIDAGSSTDTYYQGGTGGSTTAAIDLHGIDSPPPASVFRTERSGSSFSYKVDGLTPGSMYHLRLNFAETKYDGPNQRLFNVLINGDTTISSLDVYSVAGGKNRALTRDLIVQADRTGTISVGFQAVKGDAKVDALEIRPSTNLAAGKPATASSIESWSYNPALAVDYSSSTRWSSGQWMQNQSTAWYMVDLQDFHRITEVSLTWERAYAVDYQVQVSSDGVEWTTIKTVTGNQSDGLVNLAGLSGEGRFLRVYCLETSTGSNNYSLYDLKVVGSRLDDLAKGKPATSSTVESSTFGPAQAFDDDVTSRWSSGQWMQNTQSAWLSVDLGAISAIRDVRIVWEAAYAASYEIQSSLDGVTWTTLQSVTENGSAAPAFFSGLDGVGRYVRIFCHRTGPVHNNFSIRDLNVYGERISSLSFGAVATSSSNESNFYSPSMAIDTNASSRWSSGQWMRNTQIGWIMLDLGARHDLNAVVLNWEAAFAVDYQIQVSDDGQNWTSVRSIVGHAKPGVDAHGGLNGSGRYLRIYCTRVNATNNYSLYDIQVFGVPSAPAAASGTVVATFESPEWSTSPTVAASEESSTARRPPMRRESVAAAFAGRSTPRPFVGSFGSRPGRPGLRTS